MRNTDQRVVVVFMQIPNRLDHALVVAMDNIPPRWEQHLMQVVESPEGQGDPDLGNVLGRRLMPDTTETLLQALHSSGLLRPVHIDNVLMFPEPNKPYPLKQILQAMGRLLPDEYAAVDALNETVVPQVQTQPAKDPFASSKPIDPWAPNSVEDAQAEPMRKFNPHDNQTNNMSDGNTGIARNLLIEADLLEQEANIKREKAYGFAPQLRPAPPVPVAPAFVKPVAAAPTTRRTAVPKKSSKGAA